MLVLFFVKRAALSHRNMRGIYYDWKVLIVWSTRIILSTIISESQCNFASSLKKNVYVYQQQVLGKVLSYKNFLKLLTLFQETKNWLSWWYFDNWW